MVKQSSDQRPGVKRRRWQYGSAAFVMLFTLLLAALPKPVAAQAIAACLDAPSMNYSGTIPTYGAAPAGWSIASGSPSVVAATNPSSTGSGGTINFISGPSASGGSVVHVFASGSSYGAISSTLTGLIVGQSYTVAIEWQRTQVTNTGIAYYLDGNLFIQVGSNAKQTYTTSSGASSDSWTIARYTFTANATSLPIGVGVVAGTGSQSSLNPSIVFDAGSVCDSDSDRIGDSIDLDDDNDGIPDTVENGACAVVTYAPVESRYVGWYGDSPANTPDPTYNGTPNLTATAIAGGAGVNVTFISESGASIIRLANVNSNTFAAAVANNDYVFARVTLNGNSYPLRLSSTDILSVSSASGGVYYGSLVIVDLATNQSTTYYQDRVSPTTGSNQTGNYVMLPSRTYELRWYVQTGSTLALVRSLDNPALNFQLPADCDTDKDGIPNRLDLDSDNDGILDLTESGRTTGVDANGDGRLDGPVGTDGIPDSVQPAPNGGAINYTVVDTDGDSRPDFQDLDSDNDGLNDVREANGTDADGNGQADGPVNANGIPGSVPAAGLTPPNTDGDGKPDFRDLDSDNDAINDVIEGGNSPRDTNGDGIVDGGDTDGDGIKDSVDGAPAAFGDAGDPAPTNSDTDATPDFRDLDSDNDGLTDLRESGVNPAVDANNDGRVDDITDPDNDGIPAPVDGLPAAYGDANSPTLPDSNTNGTPDYRDPAPVVDTDNDGIPNGTDLDDDNDGIPDATEAATARNNGDTDGDGIVDSLDLDSDNDGILDITESGRTTGADANGDGRLDGAVGTDGIPDSVQPAPNGGAINYTVVDTDGDSRPDFQDLDSDNDGLNDVREANGTDADGNGQADGPVNANGIPGSVPAAGLTPPNTDGDGKPDFRDLDSDNDGLNDVREGAAPGSPVTDANGDGLADGGDPDGDGIPATADGNPAYGDAGDPTPVDTDSDGKPDARDLDSDNDAINDVIEGGNGPRDTNGDGIVDGNDSDGDGIKDPTDGFNGFADVGDPVFINSDNDATPDFRDPDSDNDGLSDLRESGANPALDANNDGKVDDSSDPDNDGIPAPVDGLPGAFGDANNPALPDSDNDGIPDYRDPAVATPTNTPVVPTATNTPVGPTATATNTPVGPTATNTPGAGGTAIVGDRVWNDINGNGVQDGGAERGIPGVTVQLLAGCTGNTVVAIRVTNSNGSYTIGGLAAGQYRIQVLLIAPYTGFSPKNAILDDDYDSEANADGVTDCFTLTNGQEQYSLDVGLVTGGVAPTNTPVGPTATPTNTPVAGNDTDGDGLPDATDLDDDNDGLPDTTEAATARNGGDTDGDGISDSRDLDSDNDGIIDLTESGRTTGTDANGDGRLDGPVGTDGIPDSVQPAPNGGAINYAIVDTDGDSRPDYQDLDSDNDGINDVREANGTDADGNGQADNPINANGVPGSVPAAGLTPPDTDGDGKPDFRDLDSDNDGINDVREGPGAGSPVTDANGDGLADGADPDGDGIPATADANPAYGDAGDPLPIGIDGDNKPDFRDLDSDNDAINDVIEGGNGPSDGNGDGIVDGNDSDGDGIKDPTDGRNGFGDSNDPAPTNSDNDGTPDYNDVDSDNDGITDLRESGVNPTVDGNNDGRVDNTSDPDNDGIPAPVDGLPAAFGDANNPALPDSNGNGTPDYRDPATVPTSTPVVPTATSTPVVPTSTPGGSGTAIVGDRVWNDINGNGVQDGGAERGVPGVTVQLLAGCTGNTVFATRVTNNSGEFTIGSLPAGQYRLQYTLLAPYTGFSPKKTILDDDYDSDVNPDGVSDCFTLANGQEKYTVDAGFTSGGTPPTPTPVGPTATPTNTPVGPTATPTATPVGPTPTPTRPGGFICDDGICPDADGDGVADYLDDDDDNDGIPTADEDVNGNGNPADDDSDGDGIPNYLDPLDTDGDTIPDLVEDANNDGNLNNDDTDRDGTPDYRDLDSDNDSIPDRTEAGIRPSRPYDADRDRIPNYRDTDSDNDGKADNVEGTPSRDGDGIPDYLDPDDNGPGSGDSDRDGVPDAVECPPSANGAALQDTDRDGIPDYLDTDAVYHYYLAVIQRDPVPRTQPPGQQQTASATNC